MGGGYIGRGKGGKGLGKGSVKRRKGDDADDDDDDVPREEFIMRDATATTEDATAPRKESELERSASLLQKQDELITSISNGSKDIDVVFAFDTTGSMSSYLVECRKKLSETCKKLMSDIPNIRIGIMAIGDYCDASNYVVKFLDLSNDTDKIVNWVNTVSSTGGGDAPEAYELALKKAHSKIQWREGSNRSLVMILDAYPHAPSYTTENIYWRDEVEELAKKNVKIYGVKCGATSQTHHYCSEMAEMSGGVLVELKQFDLITDMFLAVCYRELGQEHLQTYKETVAQEGRLNAGGMETMFTHLEQENNVPAPKKIYGALTESWYDRDYDKGASAQYTLLDGKWVHAGYKAASALKSPAKTSTKSPAKKEKKAVSPKPTIAKKEKKEKVTKAKAKTAVKAKEEEKKPTIARNTSHLVGNGDWKRDREGRMVKVLG